MGHVVSDLDDKYVAIKQRLPPKQLSGHIKQKDAREMIRENPIICQRQGHLELTPKLYLLEQDNHA